MKLLSRLSRARGPRGHSARDAAGPIERALDAAGLTRAAGTGGIRAAIDHALEAAGLRQPHAPDAPGRGNANGGAKAAAPADGRGQFLHATHAGAAGRRDYRLYLPAGYRADGPPRPLLMMLHGCTQSADDFAVGTRMNAHADEHGLLVAYPQQVGKANHARCWNWFRPEDQRADAGEPAILAGIVGQVARDHRVDPARVFVAGLSAGAAMALILAETRPDLVRAVGVHSGLPYASAHDVPSAFAAMQGRNSRAPRPAPAGAVPMILFHGDEDRTVVPGNADAIAAAALPAAARTLTETGRVPGGRAYTRQRVLDAAGHARLERWTVHGAGHAWSGGDAAGSYTDPSGPDASAAMLAFFLAAGDAQRA